MDVLGDILASLRLTGGVILEGSAAGEWCVTSKVRHDDVARLFPADGPLIAYHYVKRGRLFAQVGDGAPVSVDEGAIILFPRNDQHRLFTSLAKPAIDAHDFLTGTTEQGLGRFTISGEGEPVEFYCGFLGVEAGEHPLLDCLPPMLKIDDITATREAWLEGNLAYLMANRPNPEVVARIAELLFSEAIRAYIDELPVGEGGWLAGLRDPVVARALACIHARFAEDLAIETLAREAGVSRTVLGERFARQLGESPMRYCAKWRMRQAATMLRQGRDSTANIAYAVGFNSEAAFNRAFKREHGEPPVAWKRRMEDASRTPVAPHAGADVAAAVTERTGLCSGGDGLAIAYSVIGEGFPLFMTATWYHDTANDLDSPVWRHWLAECRRNRQLIRSDLRGTGSSGVWPGPWSLERLVADFAAVVDAVGPAQFDIVAFSHGSLVALAYAADYPERVRKLVIVGGYARGFAVRGEPTEIRRRESLRALSRTYKGGTDDSFAQMIGALYWPTSRRDAAEWFSARLKTIDRLDEGLEDVFRDADLQARLSSVRSETLLLHSRGDRVVSFACTEEMARHLPASRLVDLASDSHLVLETEMAWVNARDALRQFLD